MNNKLNVLEITIFVIIILTACSSNSTQSKYSKNFDRVIKIPFNARKKSHPLKLLYKFGTGNSFLIGKPYSIANIGPFTIVTDQINKTINIFRDTTYIKTVGRSGKGPGEFLHMNTITVDQKNQTFWIYDATLFRFQKFNLNDLLHTSNIKKRTLTSVTINSKVGYPYWPTWLNDTTIISTGLFTKGRIAFFNDQGIFQRIVGPTLPSVKNKNVPYKVRSHSYLGYIAVKPDGSAFVVADQHTDKLEIYNAQGHPKLLIIGADNFKPHYKTAHLPQGGVTMEASRNMHNAYVSICATNQRIYALYSGKLMNEQKGMFGNSLFIFNWKGKLLGIYTLHSNTIFNINVDTAERKLYAVDFYAKKDPISVYKLPEEITENGDKQ
jgi:DNA-binding beta-propeller fold protein YncE